MPLQHIADDMLRAMRRERSGAAIRRLVATDPRRRARDRAALGLHRRLPGRDRARTSTSCATSSRRPSSIASGSSATRARRARTPRTLPGHVPERVKQPALGACHGDAGRAWRRGAPARRSDATIEVLVEGEGASRGRCVGRSSDQAPEIDGVIRLRGAASRRPGESASPADVTIDAEITYDLQRRDRRPDAVDTGCGQALDSPPPLGRGARMRKAFLKKARETLEEMRCAAPPQRPAGPERGPRCRARTRAWTPTTSPATRATRRSTSSWAIATGRRCRPSTRRSRRVDDGTYGICESCESDIAEARLQALPFTRLCVNCQAERERELKMNRRFEEDRSFRRLVRRRRRAIARSRGLSRRAVEQAASRREGRPASSVRRTPILMATVRTAGVGSKSFTRSMPRTCRYQRVEQRERPRAAAPRGTRRRGGVGDDAERRLEAGAPLEEMLRDT